MQSLHSKKSHKRILIIVLVLVALSTNPFDIGDKTRKAINNFFNPVASYGTKIGNQFDSIFKSLGRLTSLQSEKQSLQNEVTSFKSQIAQLQMLTKENERLRKSLNLIPKHKYNLIGADIVRYDLSNKGEWVMVNRGAVDGLKKGMSAIQGKSVLIGRVSEVFDTSARIQLITSKESVLGALETESMNRLLVTGDHGLGMIASEIPRDVSLEVGMTLLSIPSESYPDVQDLGVGTVKEVYSSEDNLTQQAVLEPLFSVRELSEVYIITSIASQAN